MPVAVFSGILRFPQRGFVVPCGTPPFFAVPFLCLRRRVRIDPWPASDELSLIARSRGAVPMYEYTFAAPRSDTAVDDVQFEFEVGVVGLDERGLLTALAFHAAGARVLAVDESPGRLVSIGVGLVDLEGGAAERLESALADDRFQLAGQLDSLARARIVAICVPAPADGHPVAAMMALRDMCASVVEHAVEGQLFVLTSATYVGCTADLLAQPLNQRGFKVGEDVFVAFSAELNGPGSEAIDLEAVPRVVGGATSACGDRAAALIARSSKHVHLVPNLAVAETAKLLENTFCPVDTDASDARQLARRSHDGPD